MTTHLDDGQIAAVIIGAELDRAAADHLESCLDCRRRGADLEGLIDMRRRGMDGESPDWEAQRIAVLDRLPVDAPAPMARPRRWLRPLMAAAAAMMVVAVLGVLGPDRTEIASNGAELAVEDILAEVDELLADDSIPGFEVIDPGIDDLESYLSGGAS